MSDRYLIVNADDFGQSAGVNRGVIEAHERGVVTSATLMVRWPAAAEAAQYARRQPGLGIGLHLDLGEWAYRDSEWVRLYQVVDESDTQAVTEEVARQLDAFERMAGRCPTHLDSHQHAHRKEPASSVVLEAAKRLGIPVREYSVPYHGGFYGQDERGVSYPAGVTVESFIAILAGLGPGFTEIGCHPAVACDLDTMYRSERLLELATLCDARVRRAADEMGIEFKSFADWLGAAGTEPHASGQ